MDCNDSVACTVDSCNGATDSCNNTPDNAVCSDGLFFNGAEGCNPSLGCVGRSDPCTGQLCDETIDSCVDCFTDAVCCPGLDLVCDGACEVD